MKTLTLAAVTVNGSDVTITGTIADTTFSQPMQQITIGQVPTGNPNWSRAFRVNDLAVMVMRNGSNSVAFTIDGMVAIAAALEPSLTFLPVVTSEPADDSTTTTNPATFAVTATSELSITYQWQESSNGSSWSNLSNAGIYSGVTTATLTITPTTTGQTGYFYRCKVTNARGDTFSNAAQLTVTAV